MSVIVEDNPHIGHDPSQERDLYEKVGAVRLPGDPPRPEELQRAIDAVRGGREAGAKTGPARDAAPKTGLPDDARERFAQIREDAAAVRRVTESTPNLSDDLTRVLNIALNDITRRMQEIGC